MCKFATTATKEIADKIEDETMREGEQGLFILLLY